MPGQDLALRIPSLLFWQFCVLSALGGIIATRWLLPGLFMVLVVVLICGRGRAARYGLPILCAGLAFAWAYATRPQPPESVPAWLEPAQLQLVQGRVLSVSGVTDRRLRVLLEDVRPLDKTGEALPGVLAWTWEQGSDPDQPRPLPGQIVTLTSKLRPITGFINEDLEGTLDYWAAQNIWFTAWTMQGQGELTISGTPDLLAVQRENLRRKLVAALGGSGPGASRFRSQQPSAPDLSPGMSQGMNQGQAMLPALLFGDRYSLDQTSVKLFTRAGLVHSLALSGQHLTLAFTAGTLAAWLLSRGRGRALLRLPRRGLVLGLGLPFAIVYMWLGNAPPSLVRAGLMMLFGMLLWLGKRQVSLLDLLFFAVLCFVLAWPQAVFDLSVQLSVLAVAGIALVTPILRRLNLFWRQRLDRHWLYRPALVASSMLIVSLAAQLCSLPIVVQTFGKVPLLFVLNLLWLPVLGVVVLPLAALGLILVAIFGSSLLTEILFTLAAWPGQAMLNLLAWLDSLNWLAVAQGLKAVAPSVLGFGAAIALFAVLAGRQKSRVAWLLAGLAMCLLPSGVWLRQAEAWQAKATEQVRLRVLDVGQGQALVLEWSQGRLLLDGGGLTSTRLDPGEDVVAHALTVNRAPSLDLLIMSHGDLDHTGGLHYIMRQFALGAALYPALPSGRNTGEALRLETARTARRIPLRLLQAGEVIELGHGLRLEVVHPPPQGRFTSNNSSLVIRLSRNGHGLALLCGDAQLAALKRIVASGHDLQADVLVLPHHGSHTSLLPEFYQAVRPKLAVASCGAFNQFNFPRPEVREALAQMQVPLLTTARSGEISLIWQAEQDFQIRELRQEHFYFDQLP